MGQAYEYIEARREARKDAFIERACLLNGAAQQIVSGVSSMFSPKSKFLTLKKLYPELFPRNKMDTSKMTPKEIQYAQASVWRSFLGV